jgi:hypothetical protein
MEAETAEGDESLWWLAAPPLIWLAHLVASYATAAVYCAMSGIRSTPLTTVRVAIVVYSVVALAGIAAIGIRGLRRHRFDSATTAHDFDTPQARYRFLGFATLLLSSMSAVAVVFVALPAAFLETCR